MRFLLILFFGHVLTNRCQVPEIDEEWLRVLAVWLIIYSVLTTKLFHFGFEGLDESKPLKTNATGVYLAYHTGPKIERICIWQQVNILDGHQELYCQSSSAVSYRGSAMSAVTTHCQKFLKGQLTQLQTFYTTVLHICINFKTEYFNVIDKIIIMMGNSCTREDHEANA